MNQVSIMNTWEIVTCSLEEIWKLTVTILVAKDKNFVVMDTCNYKPCRHLGQVAKNNQSQKKSTWHVQSPL
jgi:hypothetical protein